MRGATRPWPKRQGMPQRTDSRRQLSRNLFSPMNSRTIFSSICPETTFCDFLI